MGTTSQIQSKFKQWPSIPHLDITLSPPIIKYKIPACACFYLKKSSSVGCSIGLGISQSGAYLVEQAVKESIIALFTNREIINANHQLFFAKQKGAKETVLLLDYHLPSWYPNIVKQTLKANMSQEQITDIDMVYLVDVSKKRISKVFSNNINV